MLKRQCNLSVLNNSIKRHGFRSLNSSRELLKSNTPKFDDADLLSSQITSQPYKARKPVDEFHWPTKTGEQMKKEYQARVEKMMRLSAVFQGFLFLAVFGIAGTAYQKWPQIKSWWITKDMSVDDDTIEKLIHIKKRKSMAEIPMVAANELSPEVPGLYFCGGSESTTKKGKPGIIFPTRNSIFDNKYLRDVCLATVDGIERNLAIDDKGDLLEWNQKDYQVLLPAQNLISVKESNGCAYALNATGEVLVIPLDNHSNSISNHVIMQRSWIVPWKKLPKYALKLDVSHCFTDRGEKKVIQFDTGKEHLVLISNAGKAYTCSTGMKACPGSKSYGQFGIPGMSQFDEFPICNKLHEIELLNCSLNDSNEIDKRKIIQVACGDYHTVARDLAGTLFVFGSNKFGQLGYPISYDSEQIAFPKTLSRFQSYFKRGSIVKCVDVHCSGQTTYVTMDSQPSDRQPLNNESSLSHLSYFSFGNGQFGELGNGRFMNSQSEPTPIMVLNNEHQSTEVQHWSCGLNHVICKMQSGQVLAWGGNDNGQLGNGKRIKQCKPQHIPQFLLPGVKNSSEGINKSEMLLAPQQVIAAGERSSCIYWKKR